MILFVLRSSLLSSLPPSLRLGLTRQDALRSLVFVEYKDCSRGSAAALRVRERKGGWFCWG